LLVVKVGNDIDSRLAGDAQPVIPIIIGIKVANATWRSALRFFI
jgi:hypothetical protein